MTRGFSTFDELRIYLAYLLNGALRADEGKNISSISMPSVLWELAENRLQISWTDHVFDAVRSPSVSDPLRILELRLLPHLSIKHNSSPRNLYLRVDWKMKSLSVCWNLYYKFQLGITRVINLRSTVNRNNKDSLTILFEAFAKRDVKRPMDVFMQICMQFELDSLLLIVYEDTLLKIIKRSSSVTDL